MVLVTRCVSRDNLMKKDFFNLALVLIVCDNLHHAQSYALSGCNFYTYCQPYGSDWWKVRSKFCFSCQSGQRYHCARDYDFPKIFREACTTEKFCPEGEEPYLSFIKEGKEVTEPEVFCKKCHNEDRYNIWQNTSTAEFSECPYKKWNKCTKEKHKILCKPDDSTSERYCRCDARKGFHPLNDLTKQVCSYKNYDCGRKECDAGEQLLLNYTCAPKCYEGFDRVDEDTDDCKPIPSLDTATGSPSLPTPETTNSSTTVFPPTEAPEPVSDCNVFTYCQPYGSDWWNHRSMDCFSCSSHQRYHCARDYDLPKKFREACATEKFCPKGEEPYLSYIKDGKEVTEPEVFCKKCHDEDRYNFWQNTSTAEFSECPYKKWNKCTKEKHKILCKPDDSTSERYCRCDARKGFHPLNDLTKQVCSYKNYDCGRKECDAGEQLLLNYTCAPKCDENFDRVDEDTDDCKPIPSLDTTTGSPSLPTPETTKSSTTVLPLSNCNVFAYCQPYGSDWWNHRSMDCFSCSSHQRYHCARDYDLPKKFREACATEKFCPKGKEPNLSYIKDGKEVTEPEVFCQECHDEDRYNDWQNTSTAEFSECPYKKWNKCTEEKHKILCKPDDSTSERYCRCDAREGFHPLNDLTHQVCSYKNYDCGHKECDVGEQLLLNYTCAPKCDENFDRVDEDTDDCKPIPSLDTTTGSPSLPTPETTNSSATVFPPTEAPEPALAAGRSHGQDSPPLATKWIILIVIGAFVLFTCTCLICLIYKSALGKKCRDKCCRHRYLENCEIIVEPSIEMDTSFISYVGGRKRNRRHINEQSSAPASNLSGEPSVIIKETNIHHGTVIQQKGGEAQINIGSTSNKNVTYETKDMGEGENEPFLENATSVENTTAVEIHEEEEQENIDQTAQLADDNHQNTIFQPIHQRIDENQGIVLDNVEADLIKRVMDKCITYLLENMDPMSMLSKFTEKEIFTHIIRRDIEDLEKQTEQSRKIIRRIRETGKQHYKDFKLCLLETKQTECLKKVKTVEKEVLKTAADDVLQQDESLPESVFDDSSFLSLKEKKLSHENDTKRKSYFMLK